MTRERNRHVLQALRDLVVALERDNDRDMPPFASYADREDIAAYDAWRANVDEALARARVELDKVRLEYLHNDGHLVTIEIPKTELLEGGDFIVAGIERSRARILEEDE